MNKQVSDLAWALVEATKPHLNTLERNYVFVTLGAGDTFAAIHHLLDVIAAKRIPLQPHLVMLCRTWLGPYTAHEEYGYLRRLVEGFSMLDTIERRPFHPHRSRRQIRHTHRWVPTARR